MTTPLLANVVYGMLSVIDQLHLIIPVAMTMAGLMSLKIMTHSLVIITGPYHNNLYNQIIVFEICTLWACNLHSHNLWTKSTVAP